MDNDIIYLVNSTPKYYYMLPLHFALLRRYWPECPWEIVLATEVPDHAVCQRVAREFGVRLLPLATADAGFLDSRRAALELLLAEKGSGGPEGSSAALTPLVLPMQEDFLLEGRPMVEALQEAVRLLRTKEAVQEDTIVSARLMPCPGPVVKEGLWPNAPWCQLYQGAETYGFVFQGTLWRLDACTMWYRALCEKLERDWPRATTAPAKRIEVEVRANFAENAAGQAFFWKIFRGTGRHVAWRREGPWSNAVYRCPWPYRPTAIVRGALESWAAELGEREGYKLER